MGKILAVDDEIKNLDLMNAFLSRKGHEVVTAGDGVQAWEILEQHYNDFDVILLDRMMPNMDGIQLTHKMKSHNEMKRIPIVMQTAAAQNEQIEEGVAAGVFYYLTKPYGPDILYSIVDTAIAAYNEQKALLKEINKHQQALLLIDSCDLSFSTLSESTNLTIYLSNFFPDPERVSQGISELLINAVEHGNLGITYDEKSELNNNGTWLDEVNRRQELPENIQKKVHVSYENNKNEIILTIKDEGAGFDWQKYMQIDMERATDNHGRGIAMANMMSFDSLEYQGNGNEVRCTVKL